MICLGSNKIGLIGSSFFMGWVTTILWLPLLADKIGRRWIFFVCILMTAANITILLLSNKLKTTIAMMALAGASTAGRITIGYVFANEFLPPDWQVVFGTAFNFLDGSTGTFITLYFDFIGKKYIYIA